MLSTTREVRMKFGVTYYGVTIYMDAPVLVDQQRLTPAINAHLVQSRGPTRSDGYQREETVLSV